MRVTYRNKRDFYRSEMERYKRQAEDLQEKLKQQPASPPKTERYTAKTYCTSCHVVVKYDISRGIPLSRCDCVHCGSRTLMPVAKDYSNPFE